jgi:hypothetical protein
MKMPRPCKTPHNLESVSVTLFIHDGNGLCHVDNVTDSWMLIKVRVGTEIREEAKVAFFIW